MLELFYMKRSEKSSLQKDLIKRREWAIQSSNSRTSSVRDSISCKGLEHNCAWWICRRVKGQVCLKERLQKKLPVTELGQVIRNHGKKFRFILRWVIFGGAYPFK